METLAYLYDAQNQEQVEDKEVNLNSLKAVTLTGLAAAGIVTAGVVGQADSASAHYYRGYYGGGGYYRPVRYYRPYFYRPVRYYRSYYNPCYY